MEAVDAKCGKHFNAVMQRLFDAEVDAELTAYLSRQIDWGGAGCGVVEVNDLNQLIEHDE